MTIALELGGYRVLIEETRDRPCLFWPNRRFRQFLGRRANAPVPDIRIRINLVRKLSPLKKGRILFDSGKNLWKLYDAADGFFYQGCDAATRVPLMHAQLSPDFSNVDVTLREIRPRAATRGGWSPMALMHPLLEVVLQERLARDGGALMHSSAVLVGEDVFMFFGPSGVGKSTIADFFLRRGFTVLNDERVIVRRQQRTFKAFGTPWPGSGYLYSGAQGGLKQIFALGQGQGKHVLAPIPSAVMMARLLQESYLPHWDREGLARTVDFFEGLSETYGSLQLSFCKSPDVVDFLTEQFQMCAR